MLSYQRIESLQSQKGPRRLGVLLHGFGANANDLAGLVPLIDPDRRLTWLLPEAPITLDAIGLPGGRAWFPGDRAEILQALTGSYFQDLASLDPSGLTDSARGIAELCSAQDAGLEVLAGFSQGGMIAVESVLSGLLKPSVLLVFSSALIAAARWKDLAGRHPKDYALLQSHGIEDPVLSFDQGRELWEILSHRDDATRELRDQSFASFHGGHGIPPEVLERAAGLISRAG